MATNLLQSLHHHSFLRRHYSDATPAALRPSSATPPTSLSLSLSSSINTTTNSMIAFSLSPSTTSSSSPVSTSQPISFDLLEQHLSAQNFRQADEETRRLLIVLAGEAAQKRGCVFFSEIQFISETDLKAIDNLWTQYTDNKFGYSVQKRIWHNVNKDFTKFFLKVGWMKKLDTEVEQYNYRSFPTEFLWESNKETPEGHLPLTNALRGTQLLNSILSHPAFESMEGEVGNDEDKVGLEDKGSDHGVLKSKPLSNTVFKPDYSF